MKNFFGNAIRWLRCALVALCCFSGAAAGNPFGGVVVTGTASTAATVTLGNLNLTYNGAQQSAACDTAPPGLTTAITYSDLGSGIGLKNAGSYGVTCTVTGAGYSGSASGTMVIATKSLTVSGITASNKVYDSTAAATVNTAGAIYTGLIAGDLVSVNASGAFSDKNVAIGKTVTLTSSYTGADVGNYSITSQASTLADITPATLSVSGTTAANKVYDATTSATASSAAANYTGLIGGDIVSANAAAFSNKNVTTGNAVSVSDIIINGADAGNYTITSQATTTAYISVGIVSVGTASITTSGTTMTVTNSDGAVINWPDFSIGAGATINFVQPSAASTVLIRVTGANPAQIVGKLQSNGRVFIVSPAGIVFDALSTADVGGLVASTLDLTDQNFTANKLLFSSGTGYGGIANAGAITAVSGGSVYLVSPHINNSGVISADKGEILLAAGTSVDLTTPANLVVTDAVGAPTSMVTHSGQLIAQNGTVWILGGWVNVIGTVNAVGGNFILGPTNITLINIGTDTLANAGAINVTNAGTLTAGTVNLNGTGTMTNAWAGTLTATAAGTIILSGASTLTNLGTLTNAGSVICTTLTLNPNAGIVLSSSPITFATGWNLVGNSTDAPLTVATIFGDATQVTTVWKWIAATGKWAFYTPSLTGQALTDYAASKGYDMLTTINGGEGFWVNARTPFNFALPIGNALSAAAFQTALASGWNMVSIGENKTPSQFNTALSQPQPAAGAVPTNFTALWAWDNTQSNWYFYAPSLEAQGGTALTDYITTKGYLDFTAASKKLGPGMGFWVNRQ